MEFEVGEYIRTPYHSIEKIKRISKENGWTCVTTNRDAYDLKWLKNNKVKHSKNIIDLIKVGDYVNGYTVIDVYEYYICVCDFGKSEDLREEDIKSIVTREQFDRMEYKVE